MRVSVLAIAVFAAGCVNVHRSPNRPANLLDVSRARSGPMELKGYTPVPWGGIERVTNITYFDLANCSQPSTPINDLYSDEQLMAVITAARPAVMECLVGPDRRGPKTETRATVSVFAAPGMGVEASVTGENLTPAGERCVLEAVAPVLAPLKPLPQGWPQVAAQVDFVHTADTLPAVVLGVNGLSDGAAQIRLAIPSFCSCFETWRDAAPREVEVLVNVRMPKGDPNTLTDFDPLGVKPYQVDVSKLAPRDQSVGACIKDRLKQMTFRTPRQEADIPFRFQFIDSRQDGPLDGLPAWLQHKQMEAVRYRRFAELAVALGARSTAARSYDALVKRYQENNKAIKFDALAQSCQGLLTTDDGWASAAQRKLQTDKLALTTASEVGAAAPVAESIAQTERVLASASEVKRQDEQACPRKSWKWTPGRPAQSPRLRGSPSRP